MSNDHYNYTQLILSFTFYTIFSFLIFSFSLLLFPYSLCSFLFPLLKILSFSLFSFPPSLSSFCVRRIDRQRDIEVSSLHSTAMVVSDVSGHSGSISLSRSPLPPHPPAASTSHASIVAPTSPPTVLVVTVLTSRVAMVWIWRRPPLRRSAAMSEVLSDGGPISMSPPTSTALTHCLHLTRLHFRPNLFACGHGGHRSDHPSGHGLDLEASSTTTVVSNIGSHDDARNLSPTCVVFHHR